MRCASCDAEIPYGASFCPKCGARLPDAAGSDADERSDRQGNEAVPEHPFEPSADSPSSPPPDPAPAPRGPATPREQLQGAAQAKTAPHERERTVWSGSYSGKAMVGHFILGFVLVVIAVVIYFKMWALGKALVWSIATFLVVETILWGWLMVRKLSVRYELTTQRLIHKRGLLSRETDRIELIDIDDVTFVQGPIERALGIGTIKITSSDSTHPVLELPGIDGVARVADQIDDLRRDERRRRSLHIEAI